MPDKPLDFDPIAEAARQWSSHWGPDAVPAMAAATSIMRCQQILLGRLNELLRPFGLTFARYEALMLLCLSRHGSLPLGKIGERLQVHRTSVTGLVDRLEGQGLVVRMAHAADRRTTLAEITEAGRQVAELATAILNEARFALSDEPAADLEGLFALLRDVRLAAGDFLSPGPGPGDPAPSPSR